jgi:hypothetical protein
MVAAYTPGTPARAPDEGQVVIDLTEPSTERLP